MSVSVSNPNAIFDPIVESVEAQTEAMESIAACQAAGLQAIYEKPLNKGTTAADLQSDDPVCCRTQTFTPVEPGPVSQAQYPGFQEVIRETCSDGSVTDLVTFQGDPTPCTFIVSRAAPQGEVVALDENCQEMLVGVDPNCPCKDQSGVAYPEYFLPLASDFGNQIYCVPGATYAFAWTGVTNTNIAEFLQQNASAIDLDDPSNQYVAVIGGGPYACGGFDVATEKSVPAGDPAGIGPDGEEVLHPLQISQFNRLGYYSPVKGICPGWEGDPPAEPAGSGSSLEDKLNVKGPDISCKTQAETYACLWADWWECEKGNKTVQNAILAGQGALALWALVESLELYNKLLEKNVDIICDAQEDLVDVRRCSEEILAEDGPLKACQNDLLAGHNDRIGTINKRGNFACQFADDEFECYRKLWAPIQKEYTPRLADSLYDMIEGTEFSATSAVNWSSSLEQCITENMLPELKRQFAPLMGSVNCTSNNLNDWRQELKDKAARLYSHAEEHFQKPEARMIPAIMDMSACMVQRVCELRDWLAECGKCDLETYQRGYQAHEIQLANTTLSSTNQVVDRMVETADWLDRNVPAALDIFQTCFADEARTLNPLLFDNARELAPEIQQCFEWFKDNAVCYKEFFESCYRDGECRLVKTQLELAHKLTKHIFDELCTLNNWSDTDRAFYDDNFRHVEQLATPDIVWNGNEASNDLDRFRCWWIDRTEQFLDTWEHHWLPCDIQNLKEHCDVWTYTNPLREIHSNADQMKLQGIDADEAYRYSIIEANALLNEVFHGKDEKFDYCIEDPAVLHVRKQIDQSLADLEKCTPQHCKGWLMEQTARLKADGARAEGSAYAAAQRWKFVANEQLDRKEYERQVQLLQLFQQYGQQSVQAIAASTANHTALLESMNTAILRGDKFYAHMQDSGRNAISIMGNELDTMVRMIQLWHFWPELANQGKQAFIQGSQATIDDAMNMVQMGHFWPDAAMREKQAATDVASGALDVGIRLSQLGQFYHQQATTMNQQRHSNAVTAGQLGNDFIRSGHNIHQIGANKVQQAMASSLQAGQVGLAASEIGAQHASTALEIENRMTLNALEHLRAGITSLGVGLDFLGEVRQTQQQAGAYGNNAANSMINLFRHGQQNGLMTLNASEQCRQTEFEMLCKAKDFLQNNFQITQNRMAGTASTISATNNLINQQGQNAGGAFGLLGNSLEGLFGSSGSSPPFPTGGGGFGTGFGGSGINGGIF